MRKTKTKHTLPNKDSATGHEKIAVKKQKPRFTFYGTLFLFVGLFIGLYHNLLLGREIYTHDSFIWLGSFFYFVDSVTQGSYPFWDPYSLSGTNFYPSIHTHGLLDPLIFLALFMVKVLGTSVLDSYIYFYLFRLLIFGIGAYYLFKLVSENRMAALVAAGTLLFAVAPTSFRQMGILENAFFTPFALYFLLKTFHHASKSKSHIYLGLFVVTTGISVNIFIPAFFSFNLVVFLIAIFSLGIIRLDTLKQLVASKRMMAYAAAFLVMLVFMAAPTIRLFLESKSAEGEHFPSVRIIQKNDGMFKKLVASDVGEDVLSEKFTKHQGVYSSVGNIVSFVYPDVFLYYFGDTGNFKRVDVSWDDFISEAFQYIGIFAFLIAAIGLFWSRSRYRYLAAIMLVVIAVNMLNVGAHSQTPKVLHTIFNKIFPLLGMMEVRETLSGFFLLYACMLLSLGLGIIFEKDQLNAFLEKHLKGVLILCAVIIAAKTLITYYLFMSVIYISRVDLITLIAIATFGGLFYLVRQRIVPHTVLSVIIIVVIAGDLFYYNRTMSPYVLQENVLGEVINGLDTPEAGKARFEYYRIPFINFGNGLPLAFSETIFKRKGAMSRGNNHHFLTTKRFYDYFTNVPLANQAVASGLMVPIVRFFPEDHTQKVPSRREALSSLEDATETEMLNQLIIEEGEAKQETGKSEVFSLDQFENEPKLLFPNIMAYFDYFFSMKKASGLTKNASLYLNNDNYKIETTGFSPNVMEAHVTTSIPGYLYYSDGWSKSWKAYDNDVPVHIFPANYNFKAVALSPGDHVIRFEFNPAGYRYALYLYYFGLFGASLLLLIWSRRTGEREKSPT